MTLSNDSRQAIIDNSIHNAHQAITDAEMLLEAKSFSGAINRIYYGIYNIISALAIMHDFSASKHTQLIGWFNKNYVRNSRVERNIGKIVHNAFDQRIEGDYNPLANFSCEEVAEDLVNMKLVIKTVESLITSIQVS